MDLDSLPTAVSVPTSPFPTESRDYETLLAHPRRSGREQRLARAAARGTVALLVAVPAFAILAIRERNLLWILWAMVSLWTALDVRNVAAFAFRLRRRRAVRAIFGLAACNLLISVWLMFAPIAPLLAVNFK